MEIKNLRKITLPQKWYKEKRSESERECNINMRTSAKFKITFWYDDEFVS